MKRIPLAAVIVIACIIPTASYGILLRKSGGFDYTPPAQRSSTLVKSESRQRFSVDRQGRPIQVDALLIEWKEEDTDTLKGDFLFTTDAINTPSGIAGYVRFQYRDACPLQALRFFQKAASGSVMSILFDTAYVQSPYYSVEKSGLSNDSSITVEWLIPWDGISVDSDGIYEITVAGLNAHSDTVKQFILSGKHESIQPPPAPVVTRRIIFQAIGIVLMSVIFVMLKAKATKLKK